MVKRTPQKQIEQAADDAVRTIAASADTAARVIANAAAEALKVVNEKSIDGKNDHDLIITLDTKMDALSNDIKKLNEGTTANIADHEMRLRTIEKTQEKSSVDVENVKKLVYGAVAFILISVLSAIVYLVIKK